MDDKLILTDPFLTSSVGILSVRLQEAGLDPATLPPLDAVIVSHMHFDHLSLGSLDLIENKIPRLYVPRGGTIYLPDYAFPVRELGTWEADDASGVRITAVPVKHVGFRYGVDGKWMTGSFTGYVLEYHGLTVYFAGDTAYDQTRFRATAERFPLIDLALIPIAPIHPRSFMERTHVDPPEALRAFRDLGAKTMVPMHYDTLINGFDDSGEPLASLRRAMQAQSLGSDRVRILPIGGQAVLLARPPPTLTE
jgi:L-ascorbate metabolism protein UlaG (beta-lactamase superfamily)